MQTPHGLYWECPIAPAEPPETYAMGKRVAATIAVKEAAETGKDYVVAETRDPMILYVFALDHPALPRADMTILWELSPAGQVVRSS
jgi:hypothetical protein